MAMAALFEDVTRTRNAAVPQLVMEETPHGYDVRTGTPNGDRAVLIERVSAITGMTLIAMAVISIYVARTGAVGPAYDSLMMTNAALLTGGIAYFWIGIRGMRHQTSFDLDKGLMHFGVRSHIGSSRVLRTIRFEDIESAFVKQAKDPGRPAKLYVRVGDGDDLIEVTRGGEENMRELCERISQGLPTNTRWSEATSGASKSMRFLTPAE